MTSPAGLRPVLPVMIGTAGHVDHGKTSLVKRLTGFNTDRLKEEQQRGMSIDFGVAPIVLPDGRIAGIIDVPGHEDFVRNMVSGASSIDVLMLIVAADDAVMPQTVEHMQIVKILGVSRVLVVITKIDLVGAELLDLVREDVNSFMAGAGFPGAPVLCVSNETGEGIEELRAEIGRLAGNVDRVPDERAFRMYLRDVFTIKGHGTVVTGVPSSGSAAAEEQLELLPAKKLTGIRAIQTYRQDAEKSAAHISCALNVRDLPPDDLERGMVLAAPGVYRAAQALLARVRSTSQSGPFRRRAQYRFHCGTASAVVRVQLFSERDLAADEEDFALLRFQHPIVVAAGDRFVLRGLSPAYTVGGGQVLSVQAKRTARRSSVGIERLTRALECLKSGDYVGSELLAAPNPLIKEEDLPAFCQTGKSGAKAVFAEREAAGQVIRLGEKRWLVRERAGEVGSVLKRLLARYHRENKHVWGMKPAYVAQLLDLDPAAFRPLSELVLRDSDICLRHNHLALKTFTPEINEREMRLRDNVLEKVRAAGTVARGDLQNELGMSNAEVKLITKLLVEEGSVRTIGNNYVLAAVVEQCKRALLELFQRAPVVELNAFRERTGLSRNIAVTLLEHFDSEGITKRQGSGRALLRPEALK